MKKAILVFAILLLFVATGAFAEKGNESAKNSESVESVFAARYNEAGQLMFSAAASLNRYGISPVVGIEYIMGPLDFIPSFPMEWGVAVKGIFDIYFFPGYSGFGWSAAPLATLHKGFDFGENLEFDLSVSAGLGLYGGTYNTSWFNLGFASFETISWKLNDSLWIILDYGYIGWQSVYGLGVKFYL